MGDAMQMVSDGRTVAALLNAPAYLSPLSQEDQGKLRELARRTLAPDLHARHREVSAAVERLDAYAARYSRELGEKASAWAGDRRTDDLLARV